MSLSADEIQKDPHYWRAGVQKQALIDLRDTTFPLGPTLQDEFGDVDLGLKRTRWNKHRAPTVLCTSKIWRRKTRTMYQGAGLFMVQGWGQTEQEWWKHFKPTYLTEMAGNSVCPAVYQTVWLARILAGL